MVCDSVKPTKIAFVSKKLFYLKDDLITIISTSKRSAFQIKEKTYHIGRKETKNFWFLLIV